MPDEHNENAVEALRRAFVDAGLDPTGIDLEWMSAFKLDTEARIAAGRADPAFARAKPFFVRFGLERRRKDDDGAS